MRFCGVQWHHNPRRISFECEKNINELQSVSGRALVQNCGRKNMLIKGEGELYGADCMQQFERLFELFKTSGAGILSVSGISPVYAVFEELKIAGMPKPDILTYGFVFREIMQKKHAGKPVSHIARDGENLWDISEKYGISIDTLVTLNPQIRRPDIVDEGEAVRLV